MFVVERIKPADVERLIELGYEVEMYLYNRRHRGYIDMKENYKLTSNTRAKARRILEKYTREQIQEEETYNEDLEYALQFI